MRSRRIVTALLAATAVVGISAPAAHAYVPTPDVLYNLPSDEPCLKGRGNCAVYPKSAQLPSGRLVAAFERSTVAESGSADGQTMPIHVSDDDGTTWEPLTEVPAPAYLSADPKFDPYISNWTNPYLYVLPEDVGALDAGTLLLASVVSGDDHYYLDQKAADPSWVPSNDGDRADLAIALYASTDEGASWDILDIVAEGGWQGGAAGAIGDHIAEANTYAQVDPVWEPYVMAHDGEIVVYYSDENEYTGYDPVTGVAQLDPENDTAPDSHGQVLVHKTWDGTSAWSPPIIDVAGYEHSVSGGKTVIGGGRPGMTNVVPTTDGRWFLTYEYWGGGADVRFKLADDPLAFFADGDVAGEEISHGDGSQGLLPYAEGSHGLSWGGSPVVIALPDGGLVYNAAGSGDVWVNASGASDGVWTQFQTTLGGGYSRNLQYVEGTGRIHILQGTWGGPNADAIIRYADVDLGDSAGTYYHVVNRATGQVIGTGGNVTDANIGNGDVPDVVLEEPGATADPDTQAWHVVTKTGGAVTLLNKSGGRAASIWTGAATEGQRLAQWVDNTAGGQWDAVDTGDGYVRLQSAQDPDLFVTGTPDGPVTLERSAGDGSQDWELVPVEQSEQVVNVGSGKCLDVDQASTADGARAQQWSCHGGANQGWTFRPVAGSEVEVVNVGSGKCLDVSQASTADGAAVQQWSCHGGANQRWRVEDLGGDVQVVNVGSGKCLDVDQASTADGARAQQWSCHGGANQRWQRATS